MNGDGPIESWGIGARLWEGLEEGALRLKEELRQG